MYNPTYDQYSTVPEPCGDSHNGKYWKTSSQIKVIWDTQAVTFSTTEDVDMEGIRLPLFNQSRVLDKSDGNRYDLILNRYFQKLVGIDIFIFSIF